MDRLFRNALAGVAACLAGLAALWAGTFHVARVRTLDDDALHGFLAVQRPRLTELMEALTSLADPLAYLLLSAGVVCLALSQRRFRTAATVVAVLAGANVTTQLLKEALADERISQWLTRGEQITAASWPSGHATAAMALALCLVLAAPPRGRALAALAGCGYAVGVGYAVTYLGWHFPSDVLGAYLVAMAWALLGVAGLAMTRSEAASLAPGGGGHGAAMLGAAVVPVGALLAVLALAGHDRADLSARSIGALAVYSIAIGALAWALTAGLAVGVGTGPPRTRTAADTLHAT